MSGASSLTGGAGRWNSSWVSDILRPETGLRGGHEQPASEMPIPAKQKRAFDRAVKFHLGEAEQSQAWLRKDLQDLDSRPWQPIAATLVDKIGFKRRGGVAELRVSHHAIRRQALPSRRTSEQRIVPHFDGRRTERKLTRATGAQFMKILKSLDKRAKVVSLHF